MTVAIVAVVVDAEDPADQARFWSWALRWQIAPRARSGIVELIPTDETSFGLRFRPTDTISTTDQRRIHIDLTTRSDHDFRHTLDGLLDRGARHIDIGQRPDEGHVVLADPDGNELCVIPPSNRFLAGCPRLGALNCDGTRTLGEFFHLATGWPLVWDHDEETAIQAPGGSGPKVTWSGPPLMPRPAREPWHIHLAPADGTSIEAATQQLLALGAAHAVHGFAASPCDHVIALRDPDGNPLCLELSPP